MARIVWLASYPKSGNTWVRFMLGNLWLGRAASSAEIGNQVPDIHYGLNGQHLFGQHLLVIKTHWKYWTGLPMREDTIGAIYVLRHPVDVLESCQNFGMLRSGGLRQSNAPEELRKISDQWVDDFIAHGGYPKFQQSGIGTWEENVRSWTWSGLALPKLVLRYEDLQADPVAGLTRIAKFLDLRKSDAEIAAAAERASRENMRTIEEQEIAERKEGMFYQARNQASIEAGHRFVGRSTDGNSLFTLTDDQRERARRHFAGLIREFGYAG